MMKRLLGRVVLLAVLSLGWLVPAYGQHASSPEIARTMDGIVTRLYATLDDAQRAQLDESKVQGLITPEERKILATKYWCFDANIPVIVSIMRDKAQAVVPFWLPEAGFVKTDLVVKNEEYAYEVWRKEFEAGRVELGINGFDQNRPAYFVSVGPRDAGAAVTLSHFVPEDQRVLETKPGALTYYDWTELVLTEVPEVLRGQVLLATYRGRAREAHLLDAFRKTPFPSSGAPDQVLLTWSEDPRTTQSIQWRANAQTADGVVRYREKDADGSAAAVDTAASRESMEDRLLENDRYISRFTAVLRGLKPATTYCYMVGSPANNAWAPEAEFVTAPDGALPFQFVYMGDTHRSEAWGKMVRAAFGRHPETAFYMVGGDLVGTGLYRDNWDQFFEYSKPVFAYRPLMPCPGNHDSQDGLGAGMYCGFFDLPKNGPEGPDRECTYAFEYGNALFLNVGVGAKIDETARWIEGQLSQSKAVWKFAMFHFPPYSLEEDYPDIRREWGHVFDQYHVDMVFSGHVHYYLRTFPIRNQQVVASPADGTVYVISIALPDRESELPKPALAAKVYNGVMLYQTISIDGNRLVFCARDAEGNVRDEMTIEK